MSIKHSTRNNTFSEEMLLIDEVSAKMEITKPKFQCDVCEQEFEEENVLKIP